MSGPSWRGWDTTTARSADVTSTRLTADADVANRWFPKVRSWLALGAPIELLSPLSIMRVLFILATIGVPLVGLAPRWHGVHVVPIAAATGVALAFTACLARVRSLSARAALALAVLWFVGFALLAWAGAGSGLSVAFVFFFVPMDVFVAMFFRLRVILATTLVQTAGAMTALGIATTTGSAVAVSVCLGLATLAASLAIAVLIRSTHRQGIVDADTGLPNGFGLARELVGRGGSRVFVVSAISLEGLGSVREALGYQVGTELLRRAVEDVGQVLPSGAVIGRVEGDELVVTYGIDHMVPVSDADLVGRTVPATVATATEELALTLGNSVEAGRYLVDGLQVSMRAHVGSAVSPWDGTDVAELIRRASISARTATAQRLAFNTWRGDEGVMTATDLAMLSDLREAGGRRELWLAYQPQVAAATGRTVAAEALLRWDSAVHGAVGPMTFIPLAESTGLIDLITEWVLLEALDAQTRWRARGVELPVSVNLSAKNLTRPDLSEWILAELQVRSLPPASLVIEVTETAAAVDLVLAIDLLAPLHDAGVRISIDDFGTGYTSLSILPRLPLDELKVDQSFVMASPSSPPAKAIVQSVRAMAHLLGLTVVAEGVETEEIRDLMVELGFDVLQGYLFARPMPEAELLAHLAAQAERP